MRTEDGALLWAGFDLFSKQVTPSFGGPAGLSFETCQSIAAAQGVPPQTFALLFPFLDAGFMGGVQKLKPPQVAD